MALQSSVQTVLKNSKSASSLVFINHFDRVGADKSVNLDLSIPSIGMNLTYNISDAKFSEGMSNGGFDGVAALILDDICKSLEMLRDTVNGQMNNK